MQRARRRSAEGRGVAWRAARSPAWVAVGVFALLAASGCGDDDATAPDAAVAAPDAGQDAGPPVIPWLAQGAPPLAIAPCTAGWRESPAEGGAITLCEPYPEGGPADCAPGEAHFPGAPGCRPLGDACPTGDFADTLPTAGVVYVRAGAAAGGDGSRAAPYAALADVPWATLPADTTVALARGSYPGALPLAASTRVVGACAAETTLTGGGGSLAAVVTVTTAGAPAVVGNVSIASVREPAVRVASGRRLTLTGLRVTGASGTAVTAADAATVLTLEDVVIAGTRAGTAGLGVGIDVSARARVEGVRVIVADNEALGVWVHGTAAFARLEGSVVRDTVARASDGTFGRGVAVERGAVFEAAHVLVAHNRDVGISVVGEGAVARLADVVVEDTLPVLADGSAGNGILLQFGRLEATRLVVSRTHDVGIYVSEPGTTASVSDVVVRDTRFRERDGLLGRGFVVQFGASLDAERVYVARSASTGFFAAQDATVTLTDVTVRDSTPHRNLAFGFGLAVQTGAHLSGDNVLVDGAYELGLAVLARADVTLRGVVVRHVMASACDCPDRVYGYAVAAIGATARLSGVEVSDAATCGLFLAPLTEMLGGGTTLPDPPSLDVESGVVARAPIGACVQADGYDLGRLMHDMRYVDNGRNLDSTMLPVPSAIGAF